MKPRIRAAVSVAPVESRESGRKGASAVWAIACEPQAVARGLHAARLRVGSPEIPSAGRPRKRPVRRQSAVRHLALREESSAARIRPGVLRHARGAALLRARPGLNVQTRLWAERK